jgi:pyridoxamine-phosphate oxidase
VTVQDPVLGADPLEVLAGWYREAVESGAAMPDAVALATSTPDGRPSARMVLYKGMSGGGAGVLHNYESRKARELQDNPRAAMLFYWSTLTRQVRVEGTVERLGADESDAYFATRGRESQLGAWASPQSRASAIARSSTSVSAISSASTRGRRSRGRRSGEATVWSLIPSSSGSAGNTGSTTAICTRLAMTVGPERDWRL